MIDERFLLGHPVSFGSHFYIYPPTVDDVVRSDMFPVFRKLLTTSQEELEDIYADQSIDVEDVPTPLENLLSLTYRNEAIAKQVQDAFFFFTKESVLFIYDQKAIAVGNIEESLAEAKDLDDLPLLTEDNFFDFQNLIRGSLGETKLEPPNPDEDPRVKRIKAKARYRDKVKARKGGGLHLSSTLSAICCMGLGLNPLNIGKISYAAVPVLVRYYQEKEKYETDVRSLLDGADSKTVKPKYWIRNIED